MSSACWGPVRPPQLLGDGILRWPPLHTSLEFLHLATRLPLARHSFAQGFLSATRIELHDQVILEAVHANLQSGTADRSAANRPGLLLLRTAQTTTSQYDHPTKRSSGLLFSPESASFHPRGPQRRFLSTPSTPPEITIANPQGP